eukprot:155578_1
MDLQEVRQQLADAHNRHSGMSEPASQHIIPATEPPIRASQHAISIPGTHPSVLSVGQVQRASEPGVSPSQASTQSVGTPPVALAESSQSVAIPVSPPVTIPDSSQSVDIPVTIPESSQPVAIPVTIPESSQPVTIPELSQPVTIPALSQPGVASELSEFAAIPESQPVLVLSEAQSVESVSHSVVTSSQATAAESHMHDIASQPPTVSPHSIVSATRPPAIRASNLAQPVSQRSIPDSQHPRPESQSSAVQSPISAPVLAVQALRIPPAANEPSTAGSLPSLIDEAVVEDNDEKENDEASSGSVLLDISRLQEHLDQLRQMSEDVDLTGDQVASRSLGSEQLATLEQRMSGVARSIGALRRQFGGFNMPRARRVASVGRGGQAAGRGAGRIVFLNPNQQPQPNPDDNFSTEDTEFGPTKLLSLCTDEAFRIFDDRFEGFQTESASAPPTVYPPASAAAVPEEKPAVKPGKEEAVDEEVCVKESVAEKKSTKLNPVLRLLILLQRDLFKKATSHRKTTDSVREFVRYCGTVLKRTAHLLNERVLSCLSGELASDDVLVGTAKFLQSSVVGQLVPMMILVAYSVAFKEAFEELSSEIFEPLTDLVLALDKLVGRLHSEADQIPVDSLAMCDTVELETPHPYYSNTATSQTIHVAGATHLMINFDGRCATERDRDFLELYHPSGYPVVEPLHGPPKFWPASPVVVAGDALSFRFKSAASSDLFGVKCTVTGIRLDYAKRPFLADLRQSCCQLFGRCARVLIAGSKLSKEEEAHSKWLTSSLFSAGLEHELDGKEEKEENTGSSPKLDSFSTQSARISRIVLDDLCHLRPGSDAAELDSFISKQLPPDATAKIGGEIVNQTVNIFRAASIKHLGLVEVVQRVMAAKDGRREPADVRKLLEVWQRGRQLRSHIIRTKHRLTREHEEKVTERKERDEKIDETILESDEAAMTYESLCAPVSSKSQLLLAYCACEPVGVSRVSDDIDSAPLSRSFSAPSLDSLSSMVGRQRHTMSSSNAWRAISRDWQPMQRVLLTRRAKHSAEKRLEDAREELPTLLLHFVQSETKLSDFQRFIDKHGKRARNRSRAMEAVLRVVKSSQHAPTRTSVLSSWGPPFRMFSCHGSGPTGGHYLRHVESCGPRERSRLETTFRDVMQELARILKDSSASPLLRCLCLNAWAWDIQASDYAFVLQCDVVPVVHDLASAECHPSTATDGERRLHVLAKTVYARLGALCVGFGVSEPEFELAALPPTVDHISKLHALQSVCLDQVLADARETCAQLGRTLIEARMGYRRQSSDESLFDDAAVSFTDAIPYPEYHRAEAACVWRVTLLCALTVEASPRTEAVMCGTRALGLWFELARVGSPRLQTLALGALRRCLPYVSPSNLSKMNLGDVIFDQKSPQLDESTFGAKFIRNMFRTVGKVLAVDGSAPESLVSASAVNRRSGAVRRGIAHTRIIVLRALLRAPLWNAGVRACAMGALAEMNTLVSFEEQELLSTDPNRLSALHEALCALAVLGGHVERFRVGARVHSLTRAGQTGAAIEGGLLVELDRASGRCKILFDANPNRVVECDLAKLRPISEIPADPCLIPATVELLLAVASFVRPSQFAPEKEEEETEEKLMDAGDVEMSPIASSPHESPIVEPESWACERCTFLNAPRSEQCSMCTAAAPASQASDPVKYGTVDSAQTEKTETKRTDLPEPAPTRLLYTELRSHALRALCNILRGSGALKLLFGSPRLAPVLAALVEMSSHATELGEFQSLEYLEDTEERLLELLDERSRGIEMDEAHLHRKLAIVDILPYSPFKYLQVDIPFAFDIGSSRAMKFARHSDFRTVMFAGPTDDVDSSTVGYARANSLIPMGVRAFYFEVTVLDAGHRRDESSFASVEETSAWDIAIGLYRDGMPLEGFPGAHTSFAYSARKGRAHHSGGSHAFVRDFAPPFGSGDVIGCGYDLRKGEVFFTLNGALLESPFEEVHARFHPIVWIESPGARVRANFGHEAFVFGFEATLPEDYLESLKDRSESQIFMSPIEKKRRTAAEDLVQVMGHFPVELCILALEHSRDDMQQAANWLLENGWRELDRMADRLMKSSQEAEEQRMQEEVMLAEGIVPDESKSDSEDENIGDWLAADIDARARGSATQSYLDDEIEADIPVGISEREIVRDRSGSGGRQPVPAGGAGGVREARGGPGEGRRSGEGGGGRVEQHLPVENLAIEEVESGQVLTVSSYAPSIVPAQWLPTMARFRARTGVVSAVNVNVVTVTLALYDADLAVKYDVELPLVCVHRPQRLWQDPWPLLQSQNDEVGESSDQLPPKLGIGSHLVRIEKALSILKIRRAVLFMVSDWPAETRFDPKSLGGRNAVLKLMALAASEYLSSGGLEPKIVQVSQGSGTLLEAFREQLARLLTEEGSGTTDSVPEIRLREDAYKSGDSVVRPDYDVAESLTQVLTEECILHFVQAVKNPLPVLVYRSPGHSPYEGHCDRRGCVRIPGASRLIVSFDSRCAMSSDMLTRLSFFRDEQFQDHVATYRGPGPGTYASFVVPSNRFYYRFTSSGDTSFWGYKFKVKPLDLRIDDRQALKGLNLELGCWLFDLILSHGAPYAKTDYIINLYEAISWYVVNSKASAKPRGVELLNRLMLEMQRIPPKRIPNFDNLKPLSDQMERIMSRMLNNARDIRSPLLQGIVELMAIADLVKNRETNDGATTPTSEAKLPQDDLLVDLNRLGTYFIRVHSARLITQGIDTATDITAEMREYVELFASQILILPPTPKWREFRPLRNDPSPQELHTKKSIVIHLHITQLCFDPIMGTIHEKLLRDTVKTFDKNNMTMVCKAEQSFFQRVVETSLLTLNIERDYSLPQSLLLDAHRIQKISESFYQVAQSVTLLPDAPSGAAPAPFSAAVYTHTRFTLCMWLYVASKPDGQMRLILQKGSQLDRGNMCPEIKLLDNMKLSIGFQIGNSIQPLPSGKVIPLKKWTHVAIVFGDDEICLYINAKVDGKFTPRRSEKLSVNDDPFFFGKAPFGMRAEELPGLDGSLLDVRLYLRRLNTDDLKKLMDLCQPIKRSVRSTPLRRKPVPLPRSTVAELMRVARGVGGDVRWTADMDQQVIDLFSQAAETNRRMEAARGQPQPAAQPFADELDEMAPIVTSAQSGLLDLEIHSVDTSMTSSSSTNLLSSIPVSLVRERFALIRMLNEKVAKVLPLIDFSQAGVSWSLASRMSSLRSLIFFDAKLRAWQHILQDTMTNGRSSVLINRPRALKARERGDPEGKKSIFGQLYRQLHFQRPATLRSHRRPWSVTYEGEGGQDAGGLFRDSLSAVCEDLQSSHLPLLLRCPNARLGYGNNQDKWIPAPRATSALHLSMFAFLGKLMGAAIRGHSVVLNLDLPSVVWKPLVGETITREDITSIDAGFTEVLEKISAADSDPSITPANFRDVFPYTFATLGSDGEEVELVPDGKNKPVTWENREEFVQFVEKYRLNEFKLQVEAIRRGLATIVPVQLLPLFTFSELEFMVCGKREIDVEFLKSNTRYKQGMKATDRPVKWLWEILHEFSHSDRQKFLRFVWGQSRLPLTQADFTDTFDLMPAYHSNQQSLPVSHTCFFSLELPKYTKKEVMRDKLLYAIHNCHAIDTDFAAQNVDWDADE